MTYGAEKIEEFRGKYWENSLKRALEAKKEKAARRRDTSE
jgi:hypothetical protein